MAYTPKNKQPAATPAPSASTSEELKAFTITRHQGHFRLIEWRIDGSQIAHPVSISEPDLFSVITDKFEKQLIKDLF